VARYQGFSFTSHWRAAPAVQRHLWLVTLAEKDFESKVEKYSIISDITYIALTAGRQLPSHPERSETPFL